MNPQLVVLRVVYMTLADNFPHSAIERFFFGGAGAFGCLFLAAADFGGAGFAAPFGFGGDGGDFALASAAITNTAVHTTNAINNMHTKRARILRSVQSLKRKNEHRQTKFQTFFARHNHKRKR